MFPEKVRDSDGDTWVHVGEGRYRWIDPGDPSNPHDRGGPSTLVLSLKYLHVIDPAVEDVPLP